MLRRLAPWFVHPRWPLAVALLGGVLALPALGSGLAADDFIHRVVLRGADPFARSERPLLDFFAFVSPDSATSRSFEALGVAPWWVSETTRIALFRPLSAATHLLDEALWPDAVVVQHLHSVLWLVLGVGLVGLFLRRALAGPAAGLAALLFAVCDAHAMPVAWLANRNALVALVFGVLGLLLHVRWRQEGRTRDLAGAVGSLGLGLLAGEAALGAVAWVAAWELTRERGWGRRLRGLLPSAALVGAWRFLYDALGFGAVGSGVYVDPGRTPLAFVQALVERWPLLVGGKWLHLPLDVWIFLERRQQLAVSLLATGLVAFFVVFFFHLLRREAAARFCAAGMALSAIPLCGAFPMERLLVFPGLGAFGLLALAARDRGWLDAPRVHSGRLSALVVGGLLLLHGPLSAVVFPVRAATGLAIYDRFMVAPADPPGGLAGRTEVVVQGHDFVVASSSIRRAVEGRPVPARVETLGTFLSPMEVARTDPWTVEITQEGGWFAQSFDRLFQDPERRYAVGERVERPDFTAEVRAVTEDGRPLRVAFRFRDPLEDPRFRWLRYGVHGFEEWPLPPVGGRERLVYEAVDLVPASVRVLGGDPRVE